MPRLCDRVLQILPLAQQPPNEKGAARPSASTRAFGVYTFQPVTSGWTAGMYAALVRWRSQKGRWKWLAVCWLYWNTSTVVCIKCTST